MTDEAADQLRRAAARTEAVEVVDEDGTVIDVVPRSRIRAENLRHRCTYVVVVAGPADADPAVPIAPDAEIWVHQRAPWKDVFPSAWDVAFGGLCDVGEPWEVAARRELAEEAGIRGAALRPLGSGIYEDEHTRLVGRGFLTTWPDRPSCPDGEVVALERLPIAELERWAETVTVCTDSAAMVIPAVVALLPGSGSAAAGAAGG
ncbi:MAG: NUDIX domain-containing protein [Actinomycetota bacterium]